MLTTIAQTDHQRVLDILHQVDLTAEQRLVNQELRDAVLDAEDSVCMLEQQLRIRQLHNDCVAAIQVSQQRLQKFEKEISYAHSTTRQDDEQYARECSLIVDGKQFLSEENRLTSLRGIDIARDRLSKVMPYSDLSRYFVDGAGAVLEQAEQVAVENKIDTNPWSAVMDSALQAVASMVAENATALTPLESLDAKIVKLRREVEVESKLERECKEAGDVSNSELHVRARMLLLEGVSDLIQQKFKLLAQIEQGPLVKAQDEAARAQEELSKAAMQVFQRFDTHLANLESDCDRLSQYSARARQNEQEARSLFVEQRQQSDQFLAQNLEKQTACWRELLRIEADLSALAEERREEVERRVRGYEREERRRCDMSHFATFAEGRQKQLKSAIDAIVTEKRVGAALADMVDKAVYTLSEEVSVMRKAVRETKNGILEEHAKHFRDQYLTVGELLFRKERLLEECDKKIVELRMQQEIAMDTLDPKARLISEKRSALEQQREEVVKFVALLKSKSEYYVDAFRPSDVAIRATTGVAASFNASDPIDELRKQNEERSRRLDQYFSHMSVETGKAEEALARPRPESEMKVHPKWLSTEDEIQADKVEIEASIEVVRNHKRKSLHLLQQNPETDPREKARQILAKRFGGNNIHSNNNKHDSSRKKHRHRHHRRKKHQNDDDEERDENDENDNHWEREEGENRNDGGGGASDPPDTLFAFPQEEEEEKLEKENEKNRKKEKEKRGKQRQQQQQQQEDGGNEQQEFQEGDEDEEYDEEEYEEEMEEEEEEAEEEEEDEEYLEQLRQAQAELEKEEEPKILLPSDVARQEQAKRLRQQQRSIEIKRQLLKSKRSAATTTSNNNNSATAAAASASGSFSTPPPARSSSFSAQGSAVSAIKNNRNNNSVVGGRAMSFSKSASTPPPTSSFSSSSGGAERLSAALRVSALGLNPELEPLKARAISKLRDIPSELERDDYYKWKMEQEERERKEQEELEEERRRKRRSNNSPGRKRKKEAAEQQQEKSEKKKGNDYYSVTRHRGIDVLDDHLFDDLKLNSY